MIKRNNLDLERSILITGVWLWPYKKLDVWYVWFEDTSGEYQQNKNLLFHERTWPSEIKKLVENYYGVSAKFSQIKAFFFFFLVSSVKIIDQIIKNMLNDATNYIGSPIPCLCFLRLIGMLTFTSYSLGHWFCFRWGLFSMVETWQWFGFRFVLLLNGLLWSSIATAIHVRREDNIIADKLNLHNRV